MIELDCESSSNLIKSRADEGLVWFGMKYEPGSSVTTEESNKVDTTMPTTACQQREDRGS